MNQTYLSDREVALRYAVARATPWRWAADGEFPKPLRLSPGCTRWRLEDLLKWETERASAGKQRSSREALSSGQASVAQSRPEVGAR